MSVKVSSADLSLASMAPVCVYTVGLLYDTINSSCGGLCLWQFSSVKNTDNCYSSPNERFFIKNYPFHNFVFIKIIILLIHFRKYLKPVWWQMEGTWFNSHISSQIIFVSIFFLKKKKNSPKIRNKNTSRLFKIISYIDWLSVNMVQISMAVSVQMESNSG